MSAAPRGRPPAGLSVAARMRPGTRCILQSNGCPRTERGRRLYARRKTSAEPVLGQIKQGRGFRQFLLRGLWTVRGEWALICTTHTVRKLWTALRRRRRPGEQVRRLCGSRKAERTAQRERDAETPIGLPGCQD